jgi:hypothetical protein
VSEMVLELRDCGQWNKLSEKTEMKQCGEWKTGRTCEPRWTKLGGSFWRNTCKRIEPDSEVGYTAKIMTGENRKADRDGVLERRNENLSPGMNPRAAEKSTAKTGEWTKGTKRRMSDRSPVLPGNENRSQISQRGKVTSKHTN